MSPITSYFNGDSKKFVIKSNFKLKFSRLEFEKLKNVSKSITASSSATADFVILKRSILAVVEIQKGSIDEAYK